MVKVKRTIKANWRSATTHCMNTDFSASCLPWVPEKGTVGASGDLAPLAHLALGMMGEGKMWSPECGWGEARYVSFPNTTWKDSTKCFYTSHDMDRKTVCGFLLLAENWFYSVVRFLKHTVSRPLSLVQRRLVQSSLDNCKTTLPQECAKQTPKVNSQVSYFFPQGLSLINGTQLISALGVEGQPFCTFSYAQNQDKLSQSLQI